jgi:hypothetical protein
MTKRVVVHVSGAQESIPINQFRQAGNRFLSFLKGLQIRAQSRHATEAGRIYFIESNPGFLNVYKFWLCSDDVFRVWNHKGGKLL